LATDSFLPEVLPGRFHVARRQAYRQTVVRQRVITPDCPRCHGPLWWVPCPNGDGSDCSDEHYECERCDVKWLYRSLEHEWVRFDASGRVVEILPPRVPRFRRHPR
jgi:hypothetical protein